MSSPVIVGNLWYIASLVAVITCEFPGLLLSVHACTDTLAKCDE
jgi:hypothetical protein